MTVEIEHVPQRTESVRKITDEPKDNDTVLAEIEEKGLYKVKREIVVTEEQYIVHTADGMGKESRTYWVEQNDSDEWEIVKRRRTPNRGHPKVKKSGELSTETVREELRKKAGVEVVN